ncbi:MAG: hypothetical protein JST80_02015 [Bdellovibrionales bacterium]|nr:hypothetical protein [Bdellovibrionales bacterium]
MGEFKKKVLLRFIEHFEQELAALIQSAKAAHQAATHEESRAEDRHDTFAIEASYLAAGQATRVNDLRSALNELRGYLDSQKQSNSVEYSSLVVLESQGRTFHALITRFGGGAQINIDGKSVSLVSPDSPLGEHVMGLSAGDGFSVESKVGTRGYGISAVI